MLFRIFTLNLISSSFVECDPPNTFVTGTQGGAEEEHIVPLPIQPLDTEILDPAVFACLVVLCYLLRIRVGNCTQSFMTCAALQIHALAPVEQEQIEHVRL